MTDKLYHYRAIVTRVYDGDSITADIDLGLGVWLRGQKLRLWGIDTPELRGDEREDGLAARAFLVNELGGEDAIDAGSKVILETHKDKAGKYGRWLATIWLGGRNVNEALVAAGHAEEYLR